MPATLFLTQQNNQLSHLFYQAVSPGLADVEHAQAFQKCLVVGNWLMISSLTIITVCLAITYMYEQHFAMLIQVVAHISTIVFAAFLKIGYVLRCIALHAFSQDF